MEVFWNQLNQMIVKEVNVLAEIVYYIKNPYRLIEDLYGEKLHWYQKLWIKFIILVEKWRRLWIRQKRRS